MKFCNTRTLMMSIIMVQSISLPLLGTEAKKPLKQSARTQKKLWMPVIIGAAIIGAAALGADLGQATIISRKAFKEERYTSLRKITPCGLTYYELTETPYPVCRVHEKPKLEICAASMLPDCPTSVMHFFGLRMSHDCKIIGEMRDRLKDEAAIESRKIMDDAAKKLSAISDKENQRKENELRYQEMMQKFKDMRRRNN